MEILSPEPPKQLDISLSDSSSGDDSDFDTMRNKGNIIFSSFRDSPDSESGIARTTDRGSPDIKKLVQPIFVGHHRQEPIHSQ